MGAHEAGAGEQHNFTRGDLCLSQTSSSGRRWERLCDPTTTSKQPRISPAPEELTNFSNLSCSQGEGKRGGLCSPYDGSSSCSLRRTSSTSQFFFSGETCQHLWHTSGLPNPYKSAAVTLVPILPPPRQELGAADSKQNDSSCHVKEKSCWRRSLRSSP